MYTTCVHMYHVCTMYYAYMTYVPHIYTHIRVPIYMYTCDSQCNTCNYNKLLFHLSCVINIIFYNLLHVNNYNNTLHFVPCSRAFISRIICYQNAANPLKLRIFILYLYCSLYMYYSYFIFFGSSYFTCRAVFLFFLKVGAIFYFCGIQWYVVHTV